MNALPLTVSSAVVSSSEPARLLPALRRELHENMISLDGLDALLDRVFAFETTVLNAVPSQSQTDSSEVIDFVPAGGESVTIEYLRRSEQMLKAQLDYAHEELTRSRFDIRRMELDLAAKQDQVHLMPDLLIRAARATVAERRIAELEKTVSDMKSQITEANRELEQHRSTWWAKLNCAIAQWLE